MNTFLIFIRVLFLFGIARPFTCLGGEASQDPTPTGNPALVKKPEDLKFKCTSFTFVRIKYSGQPRGGRTLSMWKTDYPDADWNFSARFQKVIGLKTNPKGIVLELTDPELKQYPFIYMAEGGTVEFTPAEVQCLRNYLLGGGFLMVDDFWGEPEWKNLQTQIKRVFPDREIADLPMNHPIFHCFYEIQEKPQVPNVARGTYSQFDGITWERPDAKEPHYRGLIDSSGRLMAIFCHNTDLGDGWEREGDNEYFYREFSLRKAYPMGINIVVYALNH